MSVLEDIQSGWEQKYREQAAGPAWNSEPQPGVVDFVNGLDSKAVVLDVGAGDGRNSAVVVRSGRQSVLLDIASTALDLAMANLRDFSVSRPVAVIGSMEEMPLASAQFDAALVLDSLPQVCNAARAIREIHRVLKPGGTAYINVFTPNDCAWGEGEQIGPRSFAFKQTLFNFWASGELEAICTGYFYVANVMHCRWMDPPHIPFRPFPHQHDAIFYTLKKR